MRAALVRELGRVPEPADVEDPAGDTLLAVAAAALNPIDVAVALGRFYGGSPPLPYIPGGEAVGRLVDTGRRVYVFLGGLGVRRNGTLAQRAAVGDAVAIPLPDGVEDAVALASGVAGLAGWLPVTWRVPVRETDRVLVLGATGVAGRVAVQAARLLGAARIVAAGRNRDLLEQTRELGADETVELGRPDLVEAFRAAAGGDGPTLVFDPLWGEPLAAALEAAAPGGRAVHVGQSAGPTATLASGVVRGKQLEIFGYSNFAVPIDVARERYLELVGHVASGRIRVDVETYPLDRIGEAWRRQVEGPGAKLVVAP